jgi:hypothetical protein
MISDVIKCAGYGEMIYAADKQEKYESKVCLLKNNSDENKFMSLFIDLPSWLF